MSYQYGPVVAGVDGSAHSLGALRWAADEAHRWTRTLVAVNVLPEDAQPSGAGPGIAAQAAAEARRWRVGVAAIGETHRGTPAEILRGLAENARLVVVGGRGAGRGDKPLGTVSRALGLRADAPVLIVHDARRWAAGDATLPRTGPVVTGFDGSDSAHRALRLAFEEASTRGVRLVVVQAWTHPDLWRPDAGRGTDLTADEAAIHDALRDAAAPWRRRYPRLDVEIRCEPGDPVRVLAAVSQRAALLVVGTRCPADRVQPPNPSVAGRVLEYAACPVLVAHGPTHATAPHLAAAR